jgi:hypothetical protein
MIYIFSRAVFFFFFFFFQIKFNHVVVLTIVVMHDKQYYLPQSTINFKSCNSLIHAIKLLYLIKKKKKKT